MIDPVPLLNANPVFMPDPVNRHHSLNQGRLAWWLALPGIDGGRSWYDLMGLAPGTLTNMAAGTGWQPNYRKGGQGQVRFSSGASNYVVASSSAALNAITAPYTIGCWINFGVTGVLGVVLAKRSAASNYPFVLLRQASSAFQLYSNAGVDVHVSGTLVPVVSTWYRVIGTHDGTNAGIYVNGVVDHAPSALAAGSSNTASVYMGTQDAGSGPSSFSDCRMDDVFVCNRAWSAQEVAADYELSSMGYPGVLNRLSGGLPPDLVTSQPWTPWPQLAPILAQ